MTKKNFRILTFSLLFAGLGSMIASLFVNNESTKMILLWVTAILYMAAALQIVIYKKRPKAGPGGAGSSASGRSEGRE